MKCDAGNGLHYFYNVHTQGLLCPIQLFGIPSSTERERGGREGDMHTHTYTNTDTDTDTPRALSLVGTLVMCDSIGSVNVDAAQRICG